MIEEVHVRRPKRKTRSERTKRRDRYISQKETPSNNKKNLEKKHFDSSSTFVENNKCSRYDNSHENKTELKVNIQMTIVNSETCLLNCYLLILTVRLLIIIIKQCR